MYTNYGDVNPMEHGGIFVQQLDDAEFEIVRLIPLEDGPTPRWRIENVLVNVTDSWIETAAVIEFADVKPGNTVGLAIACLEYYGAINFGDPDPMELDSEEKVKETLAIGGITLE